MQCQEKCSDTRERALIKWVYGLRRSVVLHNVHVVVRISILAGLTCCSPPGDTRIRLTMRVKINVVVNFRTVVSLFASILQMPPT